MTGLLNDLNNPIMALAAMLLCGGLVLAVALLAMRLVASSQRLAEARLEALEAVAARDGMAAELALTRERLAQARQAAGRAQAAAAERDLSVKIPRSFGESRVETANRMVAEALKDLRS